MEISVTLKFSEGRGYVVNRREVGCGTGGEVRE